MSESIHFCYYRKMLIKISLKLDLMHIVDASHGTELLSTSLFATA
jgi:hypothetical protein